MLESLGLTLPPAPDPVANYLGTKRSGNLLYVSGRKSALVGKVDKHVSEEAAKEAARDTVLLLLAIIKQDLGSLDHIKSIVKLQGFIRSSAKFNRQPQVLDGASEVLIALWGERGKHARTATGTAHLPYGATIQLDMIVELHDT